MTVTDMFRLDGKVAVVTGASSGLGVAFAQALAEAGSDLALGARRVDKLADTARLVEDNGRRALAVGTDVADPESCSNLVALAMQEFGRVDILINNAGTCIHKPALEVTDEEWREVMSVNVDGVWLCSQVIGGHLVAKGAGAIVNIGSMSAEIINRPQWQPAYNASKAAVHHLTKSLAAEWAPFGVRVNALAPGYMRTDMSPVDDPRNRRFWIEDAPQQRVGEPQELGPAIVFLASDASSFMTGSVLTIDGGYTVY